MTRPTDTADAPRVTVAVPVWNGEEFLARTLTALRDQDLADIEVLIGDNGSTDGTSEIARSFAAADERFTYLRSEVNRGVPWNWNRLLDRARAPYFIWNSADDVVRPGHLAACAEALDTHPSASIAFSRVLLADAHDEIVGAMDDDGLDFLSPDPAQRVELFFARQVWQVIGFGGTFRTEVLRRMGGLPAYWGGDFVLAVALAMRSPWVQVPEQLFVARRHEGQATNLQAADPVDQVRTYQPEFSRPFAFPQIALHARVLAAAVGAPAPVAERARAAAATVRRWTLPGWRSLAYDVKRNAVRLGHLRAA